MLLEAQAEALGLPLHVVELPWPCPNEVYEAADGRPPSTRRGDRASRSMVFGDLFLEDIRALPGAAARGTGLTPLFPLWQRPTDAVAHELLALGIRAVVTCVDPARRRGRWPVDGSTTRSSPTCRRGVDPCGENGEFHTFVVDGPDFA